MKIVISTNNGMVAQHFGRCPQFTFFEIENDEIKNKKVIDNPGHAPGALPRYFNNLDCDLIIAGGMGRRAQGFFQDFDIDWITGVQGDVDEVMNQYLQDSLEAGKSLCERGEGKGNGYGRDKGRGQRKFHSSH